MQDVLIPPGQTLADLTARDAAQVQQLKTAAAAARADAIAAIVGQPRQDAAAISRRVVGKPKGVSASGGGEIEPMCEDGNPQSAPPSAGALDLEGQTVDLVWAVCTLMRHTSVLAQLVNTNTSHAVGVQGVKTCDLCICASQSCCCTTAQLIQPWTKPSKAIRSLRTVQEAVGKGYATYVWSARTW